MWVCSLFFTDIIWKKQKSKVGVLSLILWFFWRNQHAFKPFFKWCCYCWRYLFDWTSTKKNWNKWARGLLESPHQEFTITLGFQKCKTIFWKRQPGHQMIMIWCSFQCIRNRCFSPPWSIAESFKQEHEDALHWMVSNCAAFPDKNILFLSVKQDYATVFLKNMESSLVARARLYTVQFFSWEMQLLLKPHILASMGIMSLPSMSVPNHTLPWLDSHFKAWWMQFHGVEWPQLKWVKILLFFKCRFEGIQCLQCRNFPQPNQTQRQSSFGMSVLHTKQLLERHFGLQFQKPKHHLLNWLTIHIVVTVISSFHMQRSTLSKSTYKTAKSSCPCFYMCC